MNTFKKILQIIFHTLIFLGLGAILLTTIIRVSILLLAQPKTVSASTVESKPVALVLGAGLNRDGTAGLVLRDRVKTASDLYFDGKVKKLLMSGDNSTEFYDEPGAMKEYAISLGVPEGDIVLDFAGRRTYDSCFRAKAIFGLEDLIIVTQAYHLPRALYLCNAFEIEVQGVPADDANYRRSSYTFWWVREIIASLKAIWDVTIAQPEVILGPPAPIFP